MTAPRQLPLEAAADTIEDWGFLAEPGLARRGDPGYLITAIRRTPTLEHYDPESVRFWVDVTGGSQVQTVDRTSPMPQDHILSWGAIDLRDRVHAANHYLTFGGVVTAAHLDGTIVVVFLSPVPLLRRGGHSQGWDPLAELVGAYFGRLAGRVGTDASLRQRLTREPPVVRYAAFLEDALSRGRAIGVGSRDHHEHRWLVAERSRLQATEPMGWTAGEDLARAAGLWSAGTAAALDAPPRLPRATSPCHGSER